MRGSAAKKNFRISVHTDETGYYGIRRAFRIRMLWLYPVIVLLITALSSLFIDALTIRIVISLVLGIFPWLSVTDKIFSTGYTHLRTQILVLLQSLCTSVSSGYSTERALLLVRPVIENTFGKKSVLIKPLIRLEHSINMHRDLKESLNAFADDLAFPEIIPVFHALGISGRIGNNSLEILRSSCQMLSEMNSVQDDINAQNSGKNAEAMILCFMPFAITFALNRMSANYVADAKGTPLGALLLTVAFVLCIISCALLFRYMTHGNGATRPGKEAGDVPVRYIFVPLVKRLMPAGFISERYELFSELTGDPSKGYENYLRKQIMTVFILTPLSAVILFFLQRSLWLSFIIPPLTAYLNLFDIKRQVNLRKEELMRDIPLFLCLMSTLLEAGILLPRAIEICTEAFPNNRSLTFEIRNVRAMILSGIPAPEAIERFSLRIKVPEAQAALLLISRYGRLGTREVLDLLSLQASACWNLTRNAARKKQERESLGMILPMTLDFISVLIVATTPAIISLGI